MINYNPDRMIYEEPSSMSIEDWKAFCREMHEEAERFPNNQNVRLTLQEAEKTLSDLIKHPIWSLQTHKPPIERFPHA